MRSHFQNYLSQTLRILAVLLIIGGCGGGGIVDNGAPEVTGSIDGGIARITLGGRNYVTMLPAGEWDVEGTDTPSVDTILRFGDSFVKFSNATEPCANNVPTSVNSAGLTVLTCSSARRQIVISTAEIVQLDHNLTEAQIEGVVDTFARFSD